MSYSIGERRYGMDSRMCFLNKQRKKDIFAKYFQHEKSWHIIHDSVQSFEEIKAPNYGIQFP